MVEELSEEIYAIQYVVIKVILMYLNKKFLAIIPARGGSKGIPKKNIIEVGGKPLIYYSIKEAFQSKYLDRVILSTDCQEIAQTAKNYGLEVPFLRPEELATDNAKTIDVLIHVVEYLKKTKENYDYIVLLQPTQPLRKSFHIDEAIENIVNKNKNSLVSVSKVQDHPLLIRSIDSNGMLVNLISQNSTVRRQDFQEFYKVNGAIYINRLDDSFTNEISLNDNDFPYIMSNEYDLDVDSWRDLEKLRVEITKNN